MKQVDKLTLRIQGTLTRQHVQQTDPLYFDVPEGITQLNIVIRYHPRFEPGQPFSQRGPVGSKIIILIWCGKGWPGSKRG